MGPLDPSRLGAFLMRQIPPSDGEVVERGNVLPLGTYRTPDGRETTTLAFPQPMREGLDALAYALGYRQDPNAPTGYVTHDALNKGGQGLAESAMVGSLGARAPAGALRSGMAKPDLDPSQAARMARAREMGFDLPMYHVTRNEFDQFDPGVRGASFFAGSADDAARGAAAGQREWTMNFASQPDKRPQRTIEALGKSETIQGLALSPNQKKFFESLPETATLDEYEKTLRSNIEKNFGAVPPWLYNEGTIKMPSGKVYTYDDLRKLNDAEFDEVKRLGVETLMRGDVPKLTYDDVKKTGRDIFGRQIAHWGPTSDEAAIARRVSDEGMGGYLVQDEGGLSIAVTDPRNIRSVNAMFDPSKSDSANLLAANPMAGAVPLAFPAPQEDRNQALARFLASGGA